MILTVTKRWAGWLLLVLGGLALVLIPFLLYEQSIESWTRDFLAADYSRWVVGLVLVGVLGSDLLLPVPSSLVSTGAGYLLGAAAGSAVSWAGMTLGSAVGYGLGRVAGRKAAEGLVGAAELDRASQAHLRWGDWIIVGFRAVPVLAEVSVVFAGMVRMPWRRFLWMAGLANLGISITYACVGAYALELKSFLVALLGAAVLPGAALLGAELARRSRISRESDS